jgi:RHS repeat-associated protein
MRSTRDSFGRAEYTQKRQGVGNSYYDSVQQVYDSVGRPYETSMPYQGTAGQAPGSGIYGQTHYDAMMRVINAQDASGGIANTAYSQNDVYQEVAPAPTGSGENTKRKQLEYDGLGRLTSVCEITSDAAYGGVCGQVTGGYSGYLTSYVYDTAPNVNSLTVTQNGQPNGGMAQNRAYYYDMQGRLTYETNPETKVNQYFYDSLSSDAKCGTVSSPGDLVKTIDNIGKVACLTYDGLHRVLSITYYGSPTTPTKKFVYESAVVNGTTMSLTAGRLAEAYTCTGTCTTKVTDIGFSYSARGELMDVYESTPHSGGYYHVSANYWPHGLLSSLILVGTNLPTIYYGGSDGSSLDGEGRITKVTASSGTSPLASNVIYTASGSAQPIGSLTSVTLGSGDSDTFGYDTLTGRLTSYTFKMNSAVAKSGALTWNANGSLGALALTDNVTPANSQTCSYSHDDLGRISSANCSVNKWNQTFAYDPFGNIKKTATVGTNFLPNYNLNTNRYSSIPGCTPTYDGDGHLTNDCSHTYTWFADGAVDKVDTVSLTYDALGRAVEQARGTSYTEIVYTPRGGKLALMNGTTVQEGFIPLPGGGTAVYTAAKGSSVAYYRHADWLGSSRLATTPIAPTTVYADAEYAPYGEAYGVTGTPDLNFTGQNQDTVPSANSGLYDFLFREYNPQHGRWISPDPAGKGAVNPAAPQSWNRYAYVGNTPLNSVDALGLYRDWMDLRMYSSMGNTSFGTTYYVDGMQVSSAVALSLLGADAAAICPSDCSGFSNTGQYVQYVATAGAGPQGYVNSSDLQQGLYDANGTFMTGAQYNAYIQSSYRSQIDAQRQALASAIAANSGGTITYQQAYDSLDLDGGHLQGGNYNFVETAYGPGNLTCGADASRCNGIHFPNSGFVHLDTSNPFTGPLGFLEHGFVDLILGNIAYTVIPRPWP